MGFSQQPGALNLPTSEGLQKKDYIKPYNNLLLTQLPLHVLGFFASISGYFSFEPTNPCSCLGLNHNCGRP